MSGRSAVGGRRDRRATLAPVLGVVLAASIGAGCALQLRSPGFYSSRSEELAAEAAAIRTREGDDPQEARREWSALLSKVSRVDSKSFLERRHELGASLASLPERRHEDADLGQDAALGIPSVFDQWCRVYVASLRGLARASSATGDPAAATRFASRAIDFARRRMLTPFARDTSIRDSQMLLAEIGRTSGDLRREAIARVSARLLDDYLQSSRGVDAFYAHMAFVEGHEARAETRAVEKYYADIMEESRLEFQAHLDEAIAIASALNAATQAMQARSSFLSKPGAITPRMLGARLDAELLQVHSDLASARSDREATKAFELGVELDAKVFDLGFEPDATPWASETFSIQLADPEAGNPYPIIRAFVREAVEIAPDDDVRASGQALIAEADRAEEVRAEAPAPERLGQAVTAFEESFDGFLETFARAARPARGGAS